MKKLILISAVFIVLFSSCKKNYNEVLPNDKNLTNLVVSDNFSWKTSVDIEILLTSSTTGVVRVNSINGANYHKGMLNSNTEYITKITIPNCMTEIVLVYNGQTYPLTIDNGKIEYNFN